MLNRNNSLLHIIDVQERLFNVMHNKDFIRDNMVRLIKGIQVLDIPIIWMEQYPKGLGSTIPEIKELFPNTQALEKSCFSSCNQEEFVSSINNSGKQKIIVMGVEAHVCVYQTVMDLMAKGFQVEVVADAVSSRTEKNYEFALRIMESEGAKLTTVEMVLFELLKESGTDEFKQISRLVK